MSIVSLTGTPLQCLMHLLMSENPGINQFPPEWYTFGTPRAQGGIRTALNVVGVSGKRSDPQLSGIRTVFYNRVDLDRLTKNLKPLTVHGATSTHAVLAPLADHWGIELSSELVVDAPVVPDATEVTLVFKNHEYLLLQDTLTLPIDWSDSIDLGTLFIVPGLNGFDPPWPYPVTLPGLFTAPELVGFSYPKLKFELAEVSKYWHVDDVAIADWLATRTVDGPYSPNALVEAVATACPQYPWQCVESELQAYNLWGSVITYNGPATGVLATTYTRVFKLRVHSTYCLEASGELSIYY